MGTVLDPSTNPSRRQAQTRPSLFKKGLLYGDKGTGLSSGAGRAYIETQNRPAKTAKRLIEEYRNKKKAIKSRLKDFSYFLKAGEEDVFQELCFCILTPQTKAVNCDKAVSLLREKGLLFRGNKRDISKVLRGLVRFHNNKASYIVLARKIFRDGKVLSIKGRLRPDSISGTRDWFVKNIKGIGYKEASHFLRNIGLGEDIAIIDRHILKNLKRLKVLKVVPNSIDRKQYIEIEEKMRRFSEEIGIPMEELDLLFWSSETGFIFK
ncbi:MAG: N-glycosylase/DNA lyase [Candidatus Omnitrophica bacterium]|nr:N-glycosylase/DNA lyase [Candidatus Omnitrophota bacterium]